MNRRELLSGAAVLPMAGLVGSTSTEYVPSDEQFAEMRESFFAALGEGLAIAHAEQHAVSFDLRRDWPIGSPLEICAAYSGWPVGNMIGNRLSSCHDDNLRLCRELGQAIHRQAKWWRSRRWIPMSERRPGVGQRVLFHYSGLGPTTKIDSPVMTWHELWNSAMDDSSNVILPTHWMAVPEGPR